MINEQFSIFKKQEARDKKKEITVILTLRPLNFPLPNLQTS
ncbi:hypothetical protein SAMN03080598_00931 [Algoriphagus boritolerans DSM 17298 = JCM 18970]|uniref:Uncharacterized protein n=1 Tax=Algoriphagus boritolerans DSM 17298 = JCM 18970 TaxID=1120964 RepID=A0A1H5TTF6_9BACT|nr:hypothetical protein SAMN03080598_00931 [Algoriphagus boritolerans DSM 17298 = JCM 18970]